MDIKTTSQAIRYSTPINEGCKRKFELMKEDYIKLKFSLLAPVYFKLGDYIEHEQFGRFEISSIQKPKFNTSNGGYDYELQFDKYYMKWKNKILMYNGEAAWNLTADLATHLSVFTSELTKIGYKYYGTAFSFSVDDSVSIEAKLISYDSTNFIEALNKYADAWGCEWWVEDSIVFFGKCEFGTAQDFEIGVNVESMTASESSGNFFTRVYGFGSERNIPTNYRPTEEGVVVQGVVQRRLMMPVDTPYIDAYPDMTTEEAIVGVVVMDNIYPRRETIVANVKTEEYRDEIEQEDGSTTIVQWDAYRFQDIGLDFKESYLLKELKVKFESGSLNGMEFNVNFVKEDDEQWFEVVRNETYGRPLPDTILYPKNGDKCILSGFDIALVGEQYVPAAEQELKEEIQKYVDKIKEDDKNYSCKMMAESVDDLYSLGSRVKLVNAAYFENGSRESRIIGYEYDLAIPYDHPVYIVGQTASYSRLQALSDKLDSLTFQGQTFTGGSGSGVYLIRKGDITPASDFNAFSALRALETFLRKDKDEVMPFLLKLAKGAEFGENSSINEFGDAIIKSLQTIGYTPGFLGKGVSIKESGEMEAQSLTLHKDLTVPRLNFNEVQIFTGNSWQTFGGGEVESVEIDLDAEGNELQSGVITLKLVDGAIGAVAVDDMAHGIIHKRAGGNSAVTIDGRNGNFLFAGFSSVYFRVTELLAEDRSKFRYVLRGVSDRWPHQHHPTEFLNFACYANPTNKDRQACSYSTTEYSIRLENMTTWEYGEANIYQIEGKLDGFSMNGKFFKGNGLVFGNAYMYGTIDQFERAPLTMSLIRDSEWIAYGETMDIQCVVTKAYADVTEQVSTWSVTRESGDVVEDAAWNLTDKARNFAGFITLEHTELYSDFANVKNKPVFTFTATMQDSNTVSFDLI